MENSLPASVLKQLEPYPGGVWTVSEETADTILISYSGDNNVHIASYTVRRCRTEQDLQAHCQTLLYSFEKSDVSMESEDKSANEQDTTTTLKIEPMDTIPWAATEATTALDAAAAPEEIQYDQHQTEYLPMPIYNNAYGQSMSSEGVFNTTCLQEQLPAIANDTFVPINNYGQMQNQAPNFQANYIFTPGQYAEGEQQWMQ